MKNCNRTLIEKRQKKVALSSGKIDKHEYFTAEKVLPFGESQMIQQAKFTHSPLRKVLKNQIKNN